MSETAFRAAVEAGDAAALRTLLADDAVRALLDAPLFSFCAPAIVWVAGQGDQATLDVLLDAGADIDATSDWDAGPWSALHHVCDAGDRALAEHLIARGATVDVHAAAGLGHLERLEALLDADPAQVNAPGPDGQQPLHMAATPLIADTLLARGAEIDARCVDHGSTPVQWAIGKRPEVARHLITERGATPDLFVAAALGETEIVEALVRQNADALRARLGMPGYEAVPPGNILCWKLGWFEPTIGGAASPHRIAHACGHRRLYERLCELSPPDVALIARCWHGELAAAEAIAAAHPGLVAGLPRGQQRVLADAAWDHNVTAVRTLLQLGFDPHLAGDHDSTPLDRASFHGFADIVALLLEHDPDPPFERTNEFGGTPLGTLCYGSVHGWRDDGDHAAAAGLLADAGHPVGERLVSRAPEAIRKVLLERGHAEHRWSRRHAAGEQPADGEPVLVVEHDPDPTDLHEPPEGVTPPQAPFVWYHATRVTNPLDLPVRIVWWEGFFRDGDGCWAPTNARGRPLDDADFASAFGHAEIAPGATLQADRWHVDHVPVTPRRKWAFRGQTPDGRVVYGEAELGSVAYG